MPDEKTNPKQVLNALITEAIRIHEDALFCCAGHTQEARRWDKLHLWLGLPTTILAAVAGVTSLASQTAFVGNLGLNTNVTTGVLSLMVATMSGLSIFLDPKGQAATHYKALNAYTALRNDARYFYEILCVQSSEIEKLETELRKLASRLNELNEQTPLISSHAAFLAQASVRSGNYDYQIDRADRSIT